MGRPKPEPLDLAGMRRAVRDFLESAGVDVAGTDLEQTPERVATAWAESFLDGYQTDPAEILKDAYPSPDAAGATEMVLLRDISFHGMCPHHLLPFHGRAHVAYIPGKKLASLSSLARLVDCFSHRLEIQETVTRQIAEALVEHLDAKGAAVAIETDQTCLTTRGVEREGTRTVTRHFSGELAERAELRSEFLDGIG